MNAFTQLFPSRLHIDAGQKSRMAVFAWDGRKTEREEFSSQVPRGKNSGGLLQMVGSENDRGEWVEDRNLGVREDGIQCQFLPNEKPGSTRDRAPRARLGTPALMTRLRGSGLMLIQVGSWNPRETSM